MGDILLMVTIIFFSKSVKFHINTLDVELINDIAKSIRECSNVEFGYIIEDGKIVGIEKEM